MTNVDILLIAAWLHWCQVPGTWFLAKRVVHLDRELRGLGRLAAAIVRVLGIAVVVVLVTLGSLIAMHPEDVLNTSFGHALIGFLSAFWLTRLLVQLWYYHALPWPRTLTGRGAHATLVAIFASQAVAYAVVYWAVGS